MRELRKVLCGFTRSLTLSQIRVLFSKQIYSCFSLWFKTLQWLASAQKKSKLLTMAYETARSGLCPPLQLHPIWTTPDFVHQPYQLGTHVAPHLPQSFCPSCSLCLECSFPALSLLSPYSTHLIPSFPLWFSSDFLKEAMEQPCPIELSTMMKTSRSTLFNR